MPFLGYILHGMMKNKTELYSLFLLLIELSKIVSLCTLVSKKKNLLPSGNCFWNPLLPIFSQLRLCLHCEKNNVLLILNITEIEGDSSPVTTFMTSGAVPLDGSMWQEIANFNWTKGSTLPE